MVLWEIFAIAGLVFIILEMVVPSMFFLNLAAAGFVTALFALIVNNIQVLLIIFVLLSILSVIFLRPILIKRKNNGKDTETGINAKYINKIVKTIAPVNNYSGAITIYDERWEARTLDDTEIPENTEVRIVKNESLVMYVEKI